MASELFVVLIIILVVLVIFLIYFFSRKQVILRQLSKFQFKNILQFRTDELTKVSGKVLHVHEPFEMPFSKRKCVAYVFKIQQKIRTGKSSRWKTLVKKQNIQDFFIEKKGEVVLVKPIKVPQNYYTYIVEDKSVSSGFLSDPTPEFQEILDKYNIASQNFFGLNKTLRYTESILEVGEIITVGGIAKWKAVNASISGYNYSKIAALESSDTQKIIITDLIKARRTDL